MCPRPVPSTRFLSQPSTALDVPWANNHHKRRILSSRLVSRPFLATKRHHPNLAPVVLRPRCLPSSPSSIVRQAVGTETLKSRYAGRPPPLEAPCLLVSPSCCRATSKVRTYHVQSTGGDKRTAPLDTLITSHLDFHHCVESDACLPRQPTHSPHLPTPSCFLSLPFFLFLSFLSVPVILLANPALGQNHSPRAPSPHIPSYMCT